MKNWNKICGLFLLFFLTASLSTAQEKVIFKKGPDSLYTLIAKLTGREVFLNNSIFFNNYLINQKLLAADHYTKNIGFFCRQEWQFEKRSGIPVRLRLGSLQQCNMLEGKR